MLTGSSSMPVKGRLFPGLGSGYARVTLGFSAEQYSLGGRSIALPLAWHCLAAVPSPGFRTSFQPHSSAFTQWPQGRGEQLRDRVLLPPTPSSSPSLWAALASLEAPPLWRRLSHTDCLDRSAALWPG